MPQMLQQLQQAWARLQPRQRMLTVAGSVLSLVALALLVKTFGEPDFKPVMTGLDSGDVQTLSAQLAAKKIPVHVSADGKGIDVPADQLDAARLEIASGNPLHSGRMGFELFDKSSWGQTEFDEKVNYQRALEGELERTIQTLEGVKSARVHLVLPTPSVFLDRERNGKASVTLAMKHGALSANQISAVERLVAGAVDSLIPRDVTIIDADSNESLNDKRGSLEGRELEAELSKRLMATLGPAVGPDNLRASVNVEYEISSSEENTDKYDPAVSAVLTSQKSSEQTGTGAGAGGVAGTAANLPNASATPDTAASADAGGETSSTENATFGVNKTVLHRVTPAGRIRRITAAILVNDIVDRKQVKGHWITTAHKRTPEQLQQVSDLANGVLGTDKQRGDIVTVQNMTFADNTAAGPEPTLLDRARDASAAFATPIRYAGMLLLFVLVWALMFRPVQKQLALSVKEIAAGPPLHALANEAATKPDLVPLQNVAAIERDPEAAKIKRELAELVQAEPAVMTRTLQTWLREDRA